MTGVLKWTPPSALEYFSSLVADDATLPLIEAAISIAQDDHPQLDLQAVHACVDRLADTLRRRLPSDMVPLRRLHSLNRYFFDELGFALNVNDYYAPANSYLPAVLQSRRGIPITLALIYSEIAGQIGLQTQGVSFPGHFLIKLSMASSFQGAKRAGEVLIDPCTGHSLSREELEERLQPYRRRPGMGADFEAPLGLFLQPAPARDILARMLRNLKEVHRATQDWPRLLNVLHRLVILLPAVPEERRDRALVLAELGQLDLALDDLVFYLHQCPNAVDVDAMAERQSAWRSNLSGRHLH